MRPLRASRLDIVSCMQLLILKVLYGITNWLYATGTYVCQPDMP